MIERWRTSWSCISPSACQARGRRRWRARSPTPRGFSVSRLTSGWLHCLATVTRTVDETFLEGRMIWVAHEVLRSGASVILDFGCWSPEERYAIRVIAESAKARFDLRHVRIEETERRARAQTRWESAPETTFAMSDADHDRFLALCRPPSPEELSYDAVPDPHPASTAGSNGRACAGHRCHALTRSSPVLTDRDPRSNTRVVSPRAGDIRIRR
jgi:hypothetical protein